MINNDSFSDYTMLSGEEENRKRGLVISIILHLLLLLICFFTFFYAAPIPEDQISGVIVQLGTVDGGDSNNEEMTPDLTENTDDAKEAEPAPDDESESAKENVKEEPAKKESTSPIAAIETSTTQDKSEILAKKKAAEARKEAQEKEEAEKKKVAEAAAKEAAEKKAAEEAKKKAAEEAARKKAEYDEKKKKFGSLLSGGQGNNNNSGNEGNPDGEPDTKALENLATGRGSIGEGLSDRTIEYKPEITDDSQKTGRVVIDICINKSGKVISATYTQKGSTTTDRDLVQLSEEGVMKYRFSSGTIDKQCGSVIIDFKLK